ncbi:hypothetical protein MJO28_006201 [Puccinia striiformis f. sp. tritici]|uniref:Uncharacterized protein n=1 Tax=Puccinia striiformis f. sp. tritici TaxID=168172 RepID=A0ACC0EGS3_9BASI|nr:hypothetical protein Pst134EB_012379 [Puccinia striiformis f. sp. tritici]KAI7953654.1 hypothetical protein MJO28_006201 [Puccinia striiformis f. sp. tritici]
MRSELAPNSRIKKQFTKYQDHPAGVFEGKNFVWYYQDLLIVEDMLANLICPASIMIKAYHEPLHDCTKTYSSSDDAEAGALLAPTTFTKEKHDQGARDPA